MPNTAAKILKSIARGSAISSHSEKFADIVSQFVAPGDPLFQRLIDNLQIISLDRDRFVFHAGDLCQAFLVLLEGNVRVQLTSASGREVTLYRIAPGGSCILTTSCLLSRENYPAEAVAETDLIAAAIPHDLFEAALEESRRFRNFVFDSFSQRLKNVIVKIEELAFTPIDARLARGLLELDERGVTKVTHHELAVELGTAREVVSRHLKRFAAHGWVDLGRGCVAVIDRGALSRLADAAG